MKLIFPALAVTRKIRYISLAGVINNHYNMIIFITDKLYKHKPLQTSISDTISMLLFSFKKVILFDLNLSEKLVIPIIDQKIQKVLILQPYIPETSHKKVSTDRHLPQSVSPATFLNSFGVWIRNISALPSSSRNPV